VAAVRVAVNAIKILIWHAARSGFCRASLFCWFKKIAADGPHWVGWRKKAHGKFGQVAIRFEAATFSAPVSQGCLCKHYLLLNLRA